MDRKERNHRALHALAGLMLVFAMGMVYIFGILEDKLSTMFTGYVLPEGALNEEHLDDLIERRATS